MANHEIYVATKGTQTSTAFFVDKNDHVVFHNEGTAELTITFDPNEDSPFCKSGNDDMKVFKVASHTASQKLKVCKDVGRFAYTGQIVGFAAEDPIVIVEKPHSYGSISTVTVVLTLLALIAGFVLGTVLKGRGTRTQG